MNASSLRICQLSEQLGALLLARHWKTAVAESCTGGGIASAITAVSGSSQWFEYGIVSYSNRAKETLLNVQSHTLEQHGAVSEAVVKQMALGVLALSGAQLAVAVSGIAGPSGGSAEKPVGSVWFAWAESQGNLATSLFHFSGSRQQIQAQAVEQGLLGLINRTEMRSST